MVFKKEIRYNVIKYSKKREKLIEKQKEQKMQNGILCYIYIYAAYNSRQY